MVIMFTILSNNVETICSTKRASSVSQAFITTIESSAATGELECRSIFPIRAKRMFFLLFTEVQPIMFVIALARGGPC